MTKTDFIRKYLAENPSNQSPTDVVRALEKKGIKVTVHHVGMVKLQLRGKRVMKRVANRSGRSGRIVRSNSNLSNAKEKIMAEKSASRSELIREHLKSVGPSERGPRAVVEALKAKGITVSMGLVSQVKASSKKKSRKKAASIAAKSRHNKNAALESWVIAKNLLDSVGGDLSAARKNLEIVAKLLHS
jgi:aspartate oxidase